MIISMRYLNTVVFNVVHTKVSIPTTFYFPMTRKSFNGGLSLHIITVELPS